MATSHKLNAKQLTGTYECYEIDEDGDKTQVELRLDKKQYSLMDYWAGFYDTHRATTQGKWTIVEKEPDSNDDEYDNFECLSILVKLEPGKAAYQVTHEDTQDPEENSTGTSGTRYLRVYRHKERQYLALDWQGILLY